MKSKGEKNQVTGRYLFVYMEINCWLWWQEILVNITDRKRNVVKIFLKVKSVKYYIILHIFIYSLICNMKINEYML